VTFDGSRVALGKLAHVLVGGRQEFFGPLLSCPGPEEAPPVLEGEAGLLFTLRVDP